MSITPMLMPFIENAFKRGVDDLCSGLITVTIEQVGNGIEIRIENSIFRSDKEEGNEEHYVGLTNTRRRLNLLYLDSYQLQVTEQDRYEANLTMPAKHPNPG